MDIDGGSLPVKAREAVVAHLSGTEPTEAFRYDLGYGVFVTINDPHGLRGCIGYLKPAAPLHEALRQAAVAASTADPRFEPLRLEEIESVRFEVTILDKPELIRADTADEYESAIVLGRDGLIVQRGDVSGLLLPQVATEYGWTICQLLQNTCRKAGLEPDGWMRSDTDVYRFVGRVFSE